MSTSEVVDLEQDLLHWAVAPTKRSAAPATERRRGNRRHVRPSITLALVL